MYGVRTSVLTSFFYTYCKFLMVFTSHIAVQFLLRKGYYIDTETQRSVEHDTKAENFSYQAVR